MVPLSNDPDRRRRQLANLRGAPAGAQRARTHGAYAQIAETDLEDKVREVFDALSADAPVRGHDGGLPEHDGMIVRQLAEALIRRDRVRETELRHGMEIADGPRKGSLRGVVEYGLRLDGLILDYARELGLTPRARMQILGDVARSARAFDLAAHWAEDDNDDGEVLDAD
jgi:hypothetical protein